MPVWVIVVIVVCVVGIIVLTGLNPLKKKGREEYLEELRKHLEGDLTPHTGFPDSFQVKFKHEGRTFIYEDLNVGGFNQVNYKGYLKTDINNPLTINFTEKPRSQIKGEVVKASDITKDEIIALTIPKAFNRFSVYANNIVLANKLFEEGDFLKILDGLQYVDVRGNPVLPIRIQEGYVSLEFRDAIEIKPNMENIRSNVTTIDQWIQKVYRIAHLIEKIYDDIERKKNI